MSAAGHIAAISFWYLDFFCTQRGILEISQFLACIHISQVMRVHTLRISGFRNPYAMCLLRVSPQCLSETVLYLRNPLTFGTNLNVRSSLEILIFEFLHHIRYLIFICTRAGITFYFCTIADKFSKFSVD